MTERGPGALLGLVIVRALIEVAGDMGIFGLQKSMKCTFLDTCYPSVKSSKIKAPSNKKDGRRQQLRAP